MQPLIRNERLSLRALLGIEKLDNLEPGTKKGGDIKKAEMWGI